MKEFFSNLDLKGWLIVILAGITIILFTYVLMSPTGWRKKIREYEKINKELQEKRDSLNQANNELKKLAVEDSLRIVMFQQRVDSVNKIIKIKDVEIKKLKKDAAEAEEIMRKTKEKIEELTNNPIKRTGSDLIESIKQKTK